MFVKPYAIEKHLSGNSNVDTWSGSSPNNKSTNANESDRLSIKKTRDAASQLGEKKNTDNSKQIEVLFEDALDLLRKEINSCTKWVFSVIAQYEFSVISKDVVSTRW